MNAGPRSEWVARLGFGLVLAVLGLSLLRVAFLSDLFGDELEHAHVAWSLDQGLLPYRDLHQTHSPLLWLLVAPLFSLLSPSVESLLALRLVSLGALVALAWVGLRTLRELVPAPERAPTGFFLMALLAAVGPFELYRFRPDAPMALCAGLAVLAGARMRAGPWRYAFLAGLALGLGAGFSTKIAPVGLAVPIAAVVESWRRRHHAPLLVVLPNALGFLVGIAPTLTWLASHGLLGEAWRDLFVLTAGMVSLGQGGLDALWAPSLETLPFVLLAAGGALLLLHRGRHDASWSPAVVVVAAALLAWTIRAISPNHRDYNLGPLALPGSIAIAALLQACARRPSAMVRALGVAGLSAWLLLHPVRDLGLRMELRGGAVPRTTLARMIRWIEAPGSTCAGYAPFHPVFCRDATDVYLRWDLRFLQKGWLGSEGERFYRGMWERAVEQIHVARPALIVDANRWTLAQRLGVLPTEEHRRLERLLAREYEPHELDGVRVWLRKAGTTPER